MMSFFSLSEKIPGSQNSQAQKSTGSPGKPLRRNEDGQGSGGDERDGDLGIEWDCLPLEGVKCL